MGTLKDIGDLIALAKAGYKAEDVREFLTMSESESELAMKKELEKAQTESTTKDDSIKELTTALDTAKAEIESLKKQISDIQTSNANTDTSTPQVDNIEKLKELFKGGDL